jgi:hypothetical protein
MPAVLGASLLAAEREALFKETLASKPDYKVWDLTKSVRGGQGHITKIVRTISVK